MFICCTTAFRLTEPTTIVGYAEIAVSRKSIVLSHENWKFTYNSDSVSHFCMYHYSRCSYNFLVYKSGVSPKMFKVYKFEHFAPRINFFTLKMYLVMAKKYLF